jgi:hypothetical protein
MIKSYLKTLFLISLGFQLGCKARDNSSSEVESSDENAQGNRARIADLEKRYFDPNSIYSSSQYKSFSLNEFLAIVNPLLGEKNAGMDVNARIDFVLSKLPKYFRANFTLVHREDPLNPRILMFGRDAQLVLGFQGNPTKKRANEIEIMAWHGDKKEFEFSLLEFGDGHTTLTRNHPRCVVCHSGVSKPIKEEHLSRALPTMIPKFVQYPYWPGVYGAMNDIIFESETKIIEHFNSLKGAMFAPNSRVSNAIAKNENPVLSSIKNEFKINQRYLEFKKNTLDKNLHRYKHLVTLEDLYPAGTQTPEFLRFTPFRPDFNFELGHFRFRPNFHLSMFLTIFLAQKIAHEITTMPEYKSFDRILLWDKFNCKRLVQPVTFQQLSVGNASKSTTPPAIKQLSADFDGIPITGGYQAIQKGIDQLKKSKGLEDTFDLVFPAAVARETQILRSYFYGPAAQSDKNKFLPINAWNLDVNGDISNYHFGFTSADLDELVLGRLYVHLMKGNTRKGSKSMIAEFKAKLGSEAKIGPFVTQSSFYTKSLFDELVNPQVTEIAKFPGNGTQSPIAPITNTAVETGEPIADSAVCDALAGGGIMEQIKALENANMPHASYPIPSGLANMNSLAPDCGSCHDPLDARLKVMDVFPLNIEKRLAQGGESIKEMHKILNDPFRNTGKTLLNRIKEVVSSDAFPSPFGSQMPFARHALSPASAQCFLIRLEKVSSTGKDVSCENTSPAECECSKLVAKQHSVLKP